MTCPTSTNGTKAYKVSETTGVGQAKINFNNPFSIKNAELQQKISEIQSDIQDGKCDNAILNQYLLVVFMDTTQNPVYLKHLNWRHFLLEPFSMDFLDSFTVASHSIRNIFSKSQCSKTLLCQLLQHSMPNIKHNRFNLPPKHKITENERNQLPFFIHLIYFCLHGQYVHCNKKPNWNIRVNLFGYLYNMLSNGSFEIFYEFLSNNLSIFKLALMEFWIWMLTTNLPNENEMISIVTKSKNELKWNSFISLIENFRLVTFSHEEVTLIQMNKDAFTTMEKCNRLCKTPKTLKSIEVGKYKSRIHEDSLFLQARNLPKISNFIFACAMHENFDSEKTMKIQEIHSSIEIFPIPLSIFEQQMSFVKDQILKFHSPVIEAVYVYICLKCGPKNNNQMRIRNSGNPQCNTCKHEHSVVKINALGKFIKFKSDYFVFCTVCGFVHTYNSFYCKHKRQISKSLKCKQNDRLCFLCNKKTSLNNFKFLNDKIGIYNSISLCHKHTPWTHQLSSLLTISDLRTAINHRLSLTVQY